MLLTNFSYSHFQIEIKICIFIFYINYVIISS